MLAEIVCEILIGNGPLLYGLLLACSQDTIETGAD